jgi:hypothetical protein
MQLTKKQKAEYQKWLREEQSRPKKRISARQLRDRIMHELHFFSKMSAEEYTFYRKWEEVRANKLIDRYTTFMQDESHWKSMRDDIPYRNNVMSYWRTGNPVDNDFRIGNTLAAFAKIQTAIEQAWCPLDIAEGEIDAAPDLPSDSELLKYNFFSTDGMHPEIILSQKEDAWYNPETWKIYKMLLSKGSTRSSPARNLAFFISDRSTRKIYGILSLSSDFNALKVRDDHIGWSNDMKLGAHKLNNTAIGSTIVPTQPLGFNYRGGKLIALLALSDPVQKAWKDAYGDTLVGVTTTSLYGAKAGTGTQYTGLKPYWRELGESAGSVPYEPTKATLALARQYLLQNYPEQFFYFHRAKNDNGAPKCSGATSKSLAFIYKSLGIESSVSRSGLRRGVFFAELYENTKEFLRGEITEDKLVKRFPTDVESLTTYWKEKHARKSIRKRTDEETVREDVRVFYSDLARMSWQQAKEEFLPPSEEVPQMTIDEYKAKFFGSQTEYEKALAAAEEWKKHSITVIVKPPKQDKQTLADRTTALIADGWLLPGEKIAKGRVTRGGRKAIATKNVKKRGRPKGSKNTPTI